MRYQKGTNSNMESLIDTFMANTVKTYAATESLRDLISGLDSANTRFDAMEYAADYYGVIV